MADLYHLLLLFLWIGDGHSPSSYSLRGWLPYLFFQESQGYVYRRNQHYGCSFRFNQYLFLLGDLLLLSYEIQLLHRLFSKDNLL